jgi:hypothetical protein
MGLFVIASPLCVARVSGPLPFPWSVVDQCQGAARYVGASDSPLGNGRHVFNFGLPPRPHFAFESVTVCSVQQKAGDAEASSCVVSKVPSGPGPALGVFDDKSMVPEAREDRGGVAQAHAEYSCCGFNGECGVLSKQSVELSGKMPESRPGEEVVSAIGQLAFQSGDVFGAEVEEFGRGAGVI